MLSKKNWSLGRKCQAVSSLINIKLYLKKIRRFDESKPVSMLGFKVYSDNIHDLFATFVEICINEEYRFASLQSGATIIDLGANVGIASLYFKYLYPEADVIGFEMDSVSNKFYRQNVLVNNLDNVVIHDAAVGEEVGEMVAYGSRRATTIVESRGKSLPNKANPEREQKITVTQLSCHIPYNKVVYIKMDIEGAEIGVLREIAAAGSLKHVAELIFELHHNEESKLQEVETILSNNGFTFNRSDIQKNGYYMYHAIKQQS